MRRFAVLVLGASLALLALVFGVGGCLERAGVQDVSPERVEYTKSTATMRPTRTKEVGYTTTPVPRFEQTQQAIDAQAAALRAEQEANRQAIEAQRLEATTQADRENLDQLRRMNDAEYAKALEELEQLRTQGQDKANIQSTLSAGILAKQQALDASEIRRAQKLDEWNTIIQVTWLAGWKLSAWFVVMVGVVVLAIKTAQRNEYDAELLRMAQRHEARLRELEHRYQEQATARAAKMNRLHRFVNDCIAVNGADDHQIPTHTKMDGWHGDSWSGVVNELKADGRVETIVGGTSAGTYIKQGTLGDLRAELESVDYGSEKI